LSLLLIFGAGCHSDLDCGASLCLSFAATRSLRFDGGGDVQLIWPWQDRNRQH
jgi:hypothetical protein